VSRVRHLAFLLLLSALASPARAQTLEEAVAQLASPDPAVVREGIESFGLIGSAEAVAPLAERIREGLPPDLLRVALDTLTVLGQPEAGPVFFDMLSHRRPDVRLLAVQGIAACSPRGADRALATALSDSSAEVRALAATTLGELGSAASIDPLFLALDHHILEAAPALARLVDAAGATRLAGYVGREPFSALRPALLTLLSRGNLASRTRVEIVARLAELATAEVRGLLEDLVRSGGLPERDPVRRAADDAATRIAN